MQGVARTGHNLSHIASSAQEVSSAPEIGQAGAAAFEITAAKSIRAFSQVFNTDRKGF